MLRYISFPFLPLAILGVLANSGFCSDEELRFFENKVRPLLIQQCVECHGPAKQEGGLRLDNEDGLRRGGESGLAIDLESVEQSTLLKAVHYVDLEMPPKGKMSDEDIEVFDRWIRSGAFWPPQVPTIVSRDGLREFSDAERSYWFFRPVNNVEVPHLEKDGHTYRHPIDAFLAKKQIEMGLAMAPMADKRTLARRLYLDLLGVPPTWQELDQFLGDTTPEAYTNLVDRLLQDSRYGERWGRYWLDLVRFAESDGYKQDDFRPTAYRYRDYVIRSFNQDKPYAQFITEQLAGDELDRDSLEMIDATGYLRLWIYEYNQRDVQGQWSAILNDVTDVTGETLLGLSYGCARCHDHKFDPLLQKDYYRLQAFFAPLMPRDDLPLLEKTARNEYQEQLAQWNAETESIRKRMDELERPIREGTIASTIEKFPPEVRPALKKTNEERLPDEKQLAHLAFLQIKNDLKGIEFKKRLKDEGLKEWEELSAQLKALQEKRPKAPEYALTVADVGPEAPATWIPGKKHFGAIAPGQPSILDATEMNIPKPEVGSTGRRTALAKWIVSPENRLTWRVIVNRMWQHHFGQGIVLNSSDFGKLTLPPSHPELLDWLANWMIEHNGSMKELHRLMVTSEAYQQASYPENSNTAMQIDPDNRYLWHFSARRLDAEQIRDSILSASGELDRRTGGASDGENSARRAVYRRAMRNSPDSLLRGFDAPDGSSSTAKRDTTTTSLQALMLLNSKWTLERATKMADAIKGQATDPKQQIVEAYHRALQREPFATELEKELTFLSKEGDLADLCHVLLNSSEFLYWE